LKNLKTSFTWDREIKGVDALRRKEKRLLAKNRRSTETRKRTPLLFTRFPVLSTPRRIFPSLYFRIAPIFSSFFTALAKKPFHRFLFEAITAKSNASERDAKIFSKKF